MVKTKVSEPGRSLNPLFSKRPVPDPARPQPPRKGHEEIKREQRPGRCDGSQAGPAGALQDEAWLMHVRICGDVSAEHEPGGEDDHDRVDRPGIVNEPAQDFHRPNPGQP